MSSLYELYQLQEGVLTNVTNRDQDVDFPDIPKEMRMLIEEFQNLFQPPMSLPPSRLFNHRIHLLPNTKPINVKPYRYPHFPKNEMETLAREILSQGIIRPSQSPFSSPVLLVEK